MGQLAFLDQVAKGPDQHKTLTVGKYFYEGALYLVKPLGHLAGYCLLWPPVGLRQRKVSFASLIACLLPETI